MYKRLINHLSEHNLPYQKQFCFQQGHLMEHAIIQFYQYSKAFDTVNHQTLISKLKDYAEKGKNVNWFKIYIKNCKQYINYNHDVTDFAQIRFCVPHGSILRPILFSIYVMT